MHSISGLESNNDGPVVASNDRLSEADKTYILSGTTWCLQTVSKEFHSNGSAAAYTTTSLEALAPVAVTNATHGSGLRWTTSMTRGSRTITTHRDFFFSAAVSLESTDDSATTASPDIIATSIHGKQVSSSSFGSTAAEVRTYDTSGRLVRQVSPTGAITVYRYNEVGQLDQIQDHENHTTTYTYHPPNQHAAGRVWISTNSAGETTETLYNERGQVEETTGSASYRITRDYNTWGELSEMRTYRSGITGDLTGWTYDEGTGLLLKKTDAAGKETNYSYYSHRSLKTRTSSRGIVTTYSYGAFGDLGGVNYGDTTPDVTLARDRLGRLSQVVDASGTRTISYNSEGQDLVSYAAGGPLSSRVVDYTWDSVLRPTGYAVNNTAFSSVRGYDSAGRLSTVTGSGSNHLHTWTPGTSTLAGVVTQVGSTPVMTRTLHHDRMQRLRGIETSNGAGTVLTRFGYSLDSVGRRIRTTRENGQAWNYAYDSRSQVTSGVKSFPDGSAIPGHSFSYSYDGIGNRTAATHGGAGTEVSYTPDALNRYANIETGGSRFVLGEKPLANAVTVNGSNAAGAGGLGFFWAKLDGDNSTNPLWSLDTVVSNGVTVTGRTWTPLASVTPTYDFDGNLTYDGRWNYTWDAENRLIRMETAAIGYAPAVGVPRQRIDCVYDGEGRRVSKTLSTWNGSAYAFTSSSRYLYDGWNLIAEYSAPSATSTSLTLRAVHTWGADLSGSLQGAGGVGGLLSTELKSPAATCYPAYDGNGNVCGWVNTSGALLDRREYSPFGQLIAHYKFGSSATLDRLRYGFSTKYNDAESGLLYYGYRYYDPVAGRWPSRDPIGESGGPNLYAFSGNEAISNLDYLGLYEVSVNGKYLRFRKWQRVIGMVDKPNEIESWAESWWARIKVSADAPDVPNKAGFYAFNATSGSKGPSKFVEEIATSEPFSALAGHLKVYGANVRQVGVATSVWKKKGISISAAMEDLSASPVSPYCVEVQFVYYGAKPTALPPSLTSKNGVYVGMQYGPVSVNGGTIEVSLPTALSPTVGVPWSVIVGDPTLLTEGEISLTFSLAADGKAAAIYGPLAQMKNVVQGNTSEVNFQNFSTRIIGKGNATLNGSNKKGGIEIHEN